MQLDPEDDCLFDELPRDVISVLDSDACVSASALRLARSTDLDRADIEEVPDKIAKTGHEGSVSRWRRFERPLGVAIPVSDGVSERPPAECRRILETWRRRYPQDRYPDHKIFGAKPHLSANPRHKKHIEQLMPLLTYHNLLTTSEGLKSNYLAPDIHNDATQQSASTPRSNLNVRPTIGEVERLIKSVRFESRLPGNRLIPVSGDIAYGPLRAAPPPLSRSIALRRFARLGGLQFAIESANEVRLASLTKYWSSGKWWKTSDGPKVVLSVKGRHFKSTGLFDLMLNPIPSRKVALLPWQFRRRPPQLPTPLIPPKSSLSLVHARQPCTSSAKHSPHRRAALPYDVSCARDLFMSGQIYAKPANQFESQNGWSRHTLNAEFALLQAEKRRALSQLDAQTRVVVDVALTAANLEEVGAFTLGSTEPKSRERRGRTALQRATRVLDEIFSSTSTR